MRPRDRGPRQNEIRHSTDSRLAGLGLLAVWARFSRNVLVPVTDEPDSMLSLAWLLARPLARALSADFSPAVLVPLRFRLPRL